MKFLLVGLGNPGPEYANSRHNVGFRVLDELVREEPNAFNADRFGELAIKRHRGKQLLLLKPNTYMNLSGKAVLHWVRAEKIPLDRLLVITDDLALPFGTIRMKGKGGAGGHNGLEDIIAQVGTENWPRLRFGIGDSFSRGKQVDYVLGDWGTEERETLNERVNLAAEGALSFTHAGLERTMSMFNNK